MTNPGFGQIGLLLCASLAMTGCEMATSGKVKDGPGTAATEAGGLSGNVRLVERDVEAPGVFQVSDKGLWDGRPSLGGIWVAHSKVKEPERVMIRNPANGKFVVGALFRREFENPGPTIQVSSDAAEALGMLAGQPQVLNVVALKREELLILKLLGASDGYVRRPFLYIGIWYGVIGGLLALALVYAGLQAVQPALDRLALSYEAGFALQGLGVRGTAMLVGYGALLGWLGAWLASARHLRDAEPRWARVVG